MNFSFVYITSVSADEARKIGRALVEERLVACANIIEGVHSIYRWEGKIQEDTEVALIVKTREARVPAVVERVKALHSYSCPCVVSLPIQDGNRDFLAWLESETE